MMRRFVGFLACLWVSSCSVLPVVQEKEVTRALPAPSAGPLVDTARSLGASRGHGDSSFLLLEEAEEALEWRLALVDSAVSSIDIQYYLWHGGSSGVLLFERLLQAADRGVRVRVLVDDFLLTGSEPLLATLSRRHPNFQLRIFNPGRVRGNSIFGTAEFIARFRALNRRMHNKTFTADRSLTIVGGRNVGDHYYGLDEDYNFIDLDVLAAGPVVDEVSDGFDKFWNSAPAFPGKHLSKRDWPERVERARARFRAEIAAEAGGKLRSFPVERKDWSRELGSLRRSMATGRGRFLQDSPNPENDERRLVTSLTELTRGRDGELILASPYLLPSAQGIENVREAVDGGRSVHLLAPTLAANNHAVVNGHYHKLRGRIVDSGADLREFRADPSEKVRAHADTDPVRSERVTLHLKTIVGNGEKCFIGSLNLDPRALEINTESGMWIESPELAAELRDHLRELGDDHNAWRVSRGEDGKLRWQSRGVTRTSPPPARWTHRLLSWISGLLPIKSQI